MPEKTAFRRRVTPSVPFSLNIEDESGKFTMAFQLCYDLNALCLFEEVTHKNFLQEMGEIFDVPSVSILTALLWAGCQTVYAGYDGLVAIRSNVTLADLPAVKKSIIDALMAQLPPEAKAKLEALLKGEEPPADPTTPATAAQ